MKIDLAGRRFRQLTCRLQFEIQVLLLLCSGLFEDAICLHVRMRAGFLLECLSGRRQSNARKRF